MGPQGELSKQIFSATSELTKSQWTKVEEALERIKEDMMGKKLLEALDGKNILFILDPNYDKIAGYNHKTNRLTVRDFDGDYSESPDYILERELYHEMLHSLQSGESFRALNFEIEVHVEVYRYAGRTPGMALQERYAGMD